MLQQDWALLAGKRLHPAAAGRIRRLRFLFLVDDMQNLHADDEWQSFLLKDEKLYNRK